MTKKIVLHGELAKHVPGGEFICEFTTAREAASAIEVNYPGFLKLLRDLWIQVIPAGQKETMKEDQLSSWTIASDELHIIPVIHGAGGGSSDGGGNAVKAILGVALIAVAIVGTGGMAAIAGGSLTGAVFGNAFGITGMQLLAVGVPMVMQAFAQAPDSADRPDRVKNTIFTGPVTSNREGSVLPYTAGERIIVGGVVVNTDLYVNYN